MEFSKFFTLLLISSVYHHETWATPKSFHQKLLSKMKNLYARRKPLRHDLNRKDTFLEDSVNAVSIPQSNSILSSTTSIPLDSEASSSALNSDFIDVSSSSSKEFEATPSDLNSLYEFLRQKAPGLHAATVVVAAPRVVSSHRGDSEPAFETVGESTQSETFFGGDGSTFAARSPNTGASFPPPPTYAAPQIPMPTFNQPARPPTPNYGPPATTPRPFVTQRPFTTRRPANRPNQPQPMDQVGMPYSFEWSVLDEPSGNDYLHREMSDGEVTQGQYEVLLPDGRRQIVTFRSDPQSGYQAEVMYVS